MSESKITNQRLKCVVVGDGAVGKTSMLISYTKNAFPLDYEPTVFDNCVHEINYEGKAVFVELFDTAGQEDYAHMRHLCYPETDVFIVCYSVDHQISLDNVQTKWIHELHSYCPKAPIILVGTKIDLRSEPHEDMPASKMITTAKGTQLARKIKAVKYMECSAITQEGLFEIFNHAVKTVLDPPKSRKCIIL